jgi:hypothetical protein
VTGWSARLRMTLRRNLRDLQTPAGSSRRDNAPEKREDDRERNQERHGFDLSRIALSRRGLGPPGTSSPTTSSERVRGNRATRGGGATFRQGAPLFLLRLDHRRQHFQLLLKFLFPADDLFTLLLEHALFSG